MCHIQRVGRTNALQQTIQQFASKTIERLRLFASIWTICAMWTASAIYKSNSNKD